MDIYWNRSAEKMSRDELNDLQLKKLKAVVTRVYTSVPHYCEKMQAKGMLPGDVKTPADVRHLPFTTKQDLRDTYPFGMFAVPMEDIVRVHASSGTTGKQTVVGYTGRDIDVWAECMARCLVMTGADKQSRVQVCYGYGLFTGGLGAHYGAEKLGAITIPASSGNTQRQIAMIKDFGTTVLCCTPSYALYIAETLYEMGYTKDDINLKAGVFGAEPWSESMRREIESKLGLEAFDIYGLSEIMGPSVSQDCRCHSGMHIWEDYYLPEIIDSDTGEALEPGQTGELVITTLDKEGLPLIRYRTRDISSLDYGPCACGRTHARLSKLAGRSDDMLIIRGVNVFPSQVETVLLNMGETAPHYQIIVDRVNNLDIMTVEVEVSETMFSDHVKGLEDVERAISKRLDVVLGLTAKVRLVEPKSIQRSEGKAKRVIDKRKY